MGQYTNPFRYIEANGLYSDEGDKDKKEEKGKVAAASSSS